MGWLNSAASIWYNFRMITHAKFVVALLAGLAFVDARAQTPVFTPDMQAKVEAAVTQVLKETNTPSAQVGIAQKGVVVFTGAYGMARLEPPMPATVEMKYGVGSVSKQFTAVAAMVLVEQGKLKLDDPVSTWFPELAHSQEITLRMLLNQVSGYSDYYTEDYLTPEMATPTNPLDLVKRWTSKPLDFQPGTKWQYSNTNYGLAALIVEKVVQEPFFVFLNAHVLKPAGLMHVIDLGGKDVPAIPQGYMQFGLGPPRATSKEAPGTVFGAGQLAMPIGDLMLWDTVVMKRNKVLKPASWQVLQSEFDLPDGTGTGYGMGFFLEARGDRRVIEHSGGLNGFTTLNQLYPSDDVAIGVLINGEAATGKLVKAIEAMVFQPAAAEPIKTDAAAEALTKTVLGQLAQGKLDRKLLAENLDYYFSTDVIADYKDSLAPLGEVKSMETIRSMERGGMDGYLYRVTGSAGQPITVFVYVTKDGLLDQLLLRK
jgi:D-alanyl-D-alanine carboxypeptidase